MRYSRSVLCAAVSALFLLAGVAYSSDQPDFSTVKRHSSKVYAYGLDANDQLSSVLVGSGIEGIPSASLALTRSGGFIFWDKIRDKVDDEGMRHVFYRQFYKPPIGAVAAASPVATAGVWLVGAEVGLHYDTNGTLVYVFGTQFEDVAATTTPVIGNVVDAAEAADEAVTDWLGRAGADPEELSPEDIESRSSRTKLLLHSTGDGDSFDYVWKVPIWDERGSTNIATLDAETGDLIAVSDTIAWSECTPQSDDQDQALGVTQNEEVLNRNVWATETNDRGVSYTHEARKVGSGSFPDIQIFMPMDGDGCNNNDYALMPVKTVSGSVRYDEYETPDIVDGRIAADALFFTYKTMATFDDLGRDGWDDNGGDAVVVFDANCGYEHPYQGWIPWRDVSMMVYDGTLDWAPTPSVAVCLRAAQPYSEAAAIDIIAHEWGHGVIFTENLWDYERNPDETASDGMIFHEGWADIVGHTVEWDNQPPGSDEEEADWEFGEDRGSPWRNAKVDDEEGGYSLHRQDDPGNQIEAQLAGNRLATAFYLLSEGGENRVCERDETTATWDGCDVEVTGIGVNKAGRILFYALTNVAGSSTDWWDFGAVAQLAAYSLYNNCPYSWARTEQRAVYESFTAIGYEPAGGEWMMQCAF